MSVDFRSLGRVHVIGACGTLMGAFALLLKRRGVAVSGSDEHVYPPMSTLLADAGIRLLEGYRPENLAAAGGRPDLVVIGNVIRRDNPEARAAIDGGVPYVSLPEFMERYLLADSLNVVVAGTHGKTTTSSMLAHLLHVCGARPSYFVGGVALDLPAAFHVEDESKGRPFVIEGDEYDTAFWDKVPKFNHYLPDHAILTSVEYDHADIYPDLAAVVRAFDGLVDRIRPGGRLIYCADYENARKVAERFRGEKTGYGVSGDRHARYTCAVVEELRTGTVFEVLDGGRAVDRITIRLPGVHNVLNALAAWIECGALGADPDRVRAGFASFRGVRRRQEVRGEEAGVTVIDDFAHHPTAVRETIRALRARYPGRRLLVAFEPRSATSRRKVFQAEYAAAFGGASRVFVPAPYDQSRIPGEDRFSTEDLVHDLVKGGVSAEILAPPGEGGAEQILAATAPGDVVAVLTNGGFGGLVGRLLEGLRRRDSFLNP